MSLKIFCPNTTLKKLRFSSNNTELFALTGECKIKVFAIQRNGEEGLEAFLLRELPAVHRDSLNSLDFTNNFKYLVTVGND